MADQLGEAVLTISADTRPLEAGLARSQQQAQQAGSAIGNALGNAAQGAAATVRSIQQLQGQLQDLQQRQITLDIRSNEFKAVQQDIIRVRDELQAIERRKVLISVDANSLTGIATRLQADLDRLQQRRLSVNIDSREFQSLGGEINRVQQQLDAVQRRAVQINFDDRSLAAAQNKLADLQQRQTKVNVDSSEFLELQRGIDAAQRELQDLSRSKLLINVDANSVTALTTELQAKLNELQQRQLKVNVNSQEFKALGVEIGAVSDQLEALQRKVVGVSVDQRSLEGLQAMLSELQQRQLKVNVDSSEFDDLQREIIATQSELTKIENRRVRIDVQPNSITGQTSRLQEELTRLQQRQLKIDVDSSEFTTLSRQIKTIEAELAAVDRKRIVASVDDRSIIALQARLQGLRTSYESVDVGSRQFRQLQREIQRTEQELQKVDRTLGNTFRQGAGNFAGGLFGALGLGVGIGAGAAAGGFLKESIQQAVELESVTRRLSNTLGQQGATSALNFTKGLSRDLGLNFRELTDSFSRFTAASTAANVPLQTQRDLFAAVAKAGQTLGLSNDAINGSFLALQQVASKGVVSMEELRQQLGERLPIALSATAKGLGISQQQLNKLVESGQLTATQFFPALTKGLNELTANAGGLETSAQKFQRFQNAWEELQASFGKNLLPSVTSSIENLTGALEGFGVVSEGKALGFGNDGIAKLLSFNGNIPNVFGVSSISTQGAQAVSELRRVQEQFSLSSREARNIFSEALAASGGGYGIFGKLSLSDEQFSRLLDLLTVKAKEFRDTNKDTNGVLKKQVATAEQLRQQEEKRVATAQRLLDIGVARNKREYDYRDALDQAAAARSRSSLDETGRSILDGIIRENQKAREIQRNEALLQRERDKPVGTQDGKNGSRNQVVIEDLLARIKNGNLELETLRLQNNQADAAALRNQQDKARQQASEADAAQRKLAATQEQTRLEQQALVTGQQVSRTAQLQLQQQEAITAAKRQQADAQQALNAELARPAGQRDRVVVDDLTVKLARANEGVRQAYADAGLSLVQNARTAADALKSAQQSFNSAARSGFQFLTPQLQQQQLAAARASVQRGVDSGRIRTGLDISTPEKLFQLAGFSDSLEDSQKRLREAIDENTAAQVAANKSRFQAIADPAISTSSSQAQITGFAEQIVPAQKQLEQAIKESTAATAALLQKDWNVYVSVPGQPTFVPIPNT